MERMSHSNTVLWVVIVLVVAFMVILPIMVALFVPTTGFWVGYHMPMDWSSAWSMMLVMMVLGGVVVVLIVVAVIYALKPSSPSGPYYPPNPPQYQPGYGQTEQSRREALEILGQRYAKGEIAREEYLRMKEDLQH
jgi:uncharacterized membrane protein